MNISNYLQKNIKSVSPSQTVAEALEIVSKDQLTHIAVVDKRVLKGMLTEECLWSMNEEDTISQAEAHYQIFYLHSHNQLLDTFVLFETYDSNIIPILNSQNLYEGSLLMEDVVYGFSKYPFVEETGVIMELEIPYSSYSMAEVGRIVESHNGKLYGSIISEMNTESITLTLKISADEISSIGETFERFGYVVKQKYYEDKKDKLMEERYEQFQKYLDL